MSDMVETPIGHAFEIARSGPREKPRKGEPVRVASSSEIPAGGKRIVAPREGLSVGVFRIDGKLYAMKNVCPHNGAPLCLGSIHGTNEPSDTREYRGALEGRVIRCPWHGWEFDIVTGKALYDGLSRVATYTVEEDDAGNVYLWI